MSTTRTALLEGSQKAIEDAKQEYDRISQVVAALPDALLQTDYKLAVTRWPAHNNSLATVKVVVSTRQEALEVLGLFPLLPLARVRGTFLSFKPLKCVSNKEREDAREIHDMIYPVTYQYDDYNGANLHVYTELLHGRWAHLQIHITDDPAHIVADHAHDDQGRIAQYRWYLHRAPAGERDRYASGSSDKCGRFVIWFPAGPGAPELAGYLRVEQRQ